MKRREDQLQRRGHGGKLVAQATEMRTQVQFMKMPAKAAWLR